MCTTKLHCNTRKKGGTTLPISGSRAPSRARTAAVQVSAGQALDASGHTHEVASHVAASGGCSNVKASAVIAQANSAWCCRPSFLAHAERRLLGSWIVEARKRGLRNHQIVTWVRRKVGPDIMVWRYHGDGLLACATPCLFCARELQRFDMRVHCSQGDETWFSGRLHEEQAPEARPTAGQIRTIFRPQRKNQERQQRVSTKRPVPVHVPDWLERPPNQAQGQRQSSKSSKRGSSKER